MPSRDFRTAALTLFVIGGVLVLIIAAATLANLVQLTMDRHEAVTKGRLIPEGTVMMAAVTQLRDSGEVIHFHILVPEDQAAKIEEQLVFYARPFVPSME